MASDERRARTRHLIGRLWSGPGRQPHDETRWPIGALLVLCVVACGDPASTDAGVERTDAGTDAALPEIDAGPADAGVPTWRAETPTPVAVQEMAVEAHDGAIWVAGGSDGSSVFTAVRRYDPLTRTWSDGPDLPSPRHHLSLVSHAGELFALGGMQTLAFEPLDTAWVLRAGAAAWEPIAPMPRDRGAAAADSVGDVIVVAGGNEMRGGLASETLIYDPLAELWVIGAAIPTPREHLAAVAVDGELHVLAGRRNSLGSTRTEHEVYDPVMDAWRAGPELPRPRGGFDAAALAGGIYVIGGEEPGGALSTVDRFDLAAGTWAAAPPTATPHHGHGAATLAGRIYVVAGAGSPGFSPFDVVESFGP